MLRNNVQIIHKSPKWLDNCGNSIPQLSIQQQFIWDSITQDFVETA